MKNNIRYEIGFFGQGWPKYIVIYIIGCILLYNWKQTISGDVTKQYMLLKLLEDTQIVSYKCYTDLVKKPLLVNNPQVTKAFNMLVGTSEHIRLLFS